MVASEETRLARKKQNRQAQVVYRGRKRAADTAQKDRINQLENVVEQMSSVFLDFADELMGYEDFQRNRDIVDCLRKTIEAMVRLGGEVVDSEYPEGMTEKPIEKPTSKPPTQVKAQEGQRYEKKQPVIDVCPETNQLPRSALDLIPHEPLFSAIEPLKQTHFAPIPSLDISQKITYSPKIPPSFFGNGWLPYHGEFVDMTPPFDGVYVPPTSLSYRLVERTLATTYSVLFRDEHITNTQTQEIFKYTLQCKSREGILTHVRWMLGPGRHRVFRAVDIPASRVAELIWKGQAHLIDCTGEGIFRTESYEQGVAREPLPPAMLSAMEVQQKLEQLGAREVGNDLLELTLPGRVDYASSPDLEDGGFQGQQHTSAATRIRLSVSRLISNLSLTAMCLTVGPGYRSDGLYNAVQASVVPTPFG